MDTAEHDPFRPRCVDELVGDWNPLFALLTNPTPPHIVLAGGPGSGKSCAARILLGSTVTLWLRCSTDPSLRENRERIKAAARRRTDDVTWIVLEHADLLHSDSQAFLRRIIETSTGSTRFLLEVRDLAAIAEPLLSRTTLVVAPVALKHEIRTEIMRRAPACPIEIADRLAGQCEGNLRWAVLQGLGGGEGFIDEAMPARSAVDKTWASTLAIMEQLQATGTSPRVWLNLPTTLWERPGGICVWATTAASLIA